MGRKFITLLVSCVIVLCLLPIASVIIAAIAGSFETVSSLAETVLLRYTVNTLLLAILVACGSIFIGTLTAWIVVVTEFPGRKILEIALVIPFAFPAYILAYAYTDLLDHPGVVQSALRSLTGWGPRDYWFPEIRSLTGAAMMLTLVLYPYVYLLARSTFQNHVANAFNVGRSLGASPAKAFLYVTVPMARPAIAAGGLLVIMETIADFGTVAYFSVQTFATGIYTSWLGLGDRGAAAQLALGLLAFALLLAFLEYNNRGDNKYSDVEGSSNTVSRFHLRGGMALLAQIVCAIPVLLGAVIPAVALVVMSLNSEQNILSERYLGFIWNTVFLGGLAAVVTVAAAVFLSTLNRFSSNRISLFAMFAGRLGYAVPGGVIAVGLLVPFANFDNWIDANMEELFGISTGLFISGSVTLLILAYMIRFLAAAIGSYDSGLDAIPETYDRAAQMMGSSIGRTIRKIHLPLLKLNVLTGMLIIFVDTVKELPATLILRPFNYDTLAVQAFRLASDERLEAAAIPSLMIAAIGLVPAIILCAKINKTQKRRA